MAKKLLTKVDDTGIKESSCNGGTIQTLLYVDCNGVWYKLIIHSESYERQSYIRLSSSSNRSEWAILITGNPKRDFGIDLSYRNGFSSTAFARIIKNYEERLKKLLKATYPTGTENNGKEKE